MEYINEFHKQWIERTRKSIALWSKQPASLEEKRKQQERLDQQRANFICQFRRFMDPPSNLNIEFLSKGGENEVYTGNEDIVVKLNNFEYAGDDLWNRWRFVFY